MNKKTYFFGNWKMQGSYAKVQAFTDVFQNYRAPDTCDVALFVPFPYLNTIAGLFQHSGAQDCSAHISGSYTGDISASMLQDMKVTYVLVGHSERRTYYNEKSDILVKKCKAIQDAGLTPVICIGESLQDRKDNKTLEVLKQQIDPFLTCPSPKIFAYEPIWAIGTGINATVQDLEPVYTFLKSLTPDPLLYGGSVTPENVSTFLSLPYIDGVLVGGASLDPHSWKALIEFKRIKEK